MELPLNQTVIDLLKSCNFHVEASGQCQNCHQSPSFIKCSHCCLSICFECANQHRRETLTTLTNQVNTLEQQSLQMNDRVDHTRKSLAETKEQSLQTIKNHYTRLIEELRMAQINHEEKIERQAKIQQQDFDLLVEDYKNRVQQISKIINELRGTITDWSTADEYQQLKTKLAHLEVDIREANGMFDERLPELKVFEIDQHDPKKNSKVNHAELSIQNDELLIGNGKNTLSTLAGTIQIQQLDGQT